MEEYFINTSGLIISNDVKFSKDDLSSLKLINQPTKLNYVNQKNIFKYF